MKQDARTCLSLMSQGLLYPEHIPLVLAALEEVICAHAHIHTHTQPHTHTGPPACCQCSEPNAAQGVVRLKTTCAILICLLCDAYSIFCCEFCMWVAPLWRNICSQLLSEYLTIVAAVSYLIVGVMRKPSNISWFHLDTRTAIFLSCGNKISCYTQVI